MSGGHLKEVKKGGNDGLIFFFLSILLFFPHFYFWQYQWSVLCTMPVCTSTSEGCLQVNNERLKTAQLGILLSFSLTYAFFFQHSFCGEEMGKEKEWKENEWNEEGESDGKKRRK